ncbi:MmcQ/YjbR family DNA-binding protein [Neisseria leonii]|uniref:MmcQ/YjbR family DNA-binding protein n=1 Tax=Neisseria leonii TaxID=2995413 RepID=A0A9X4IDY3_9NEIS|nr:MmcQ/YjbR family DNA-binding protein [Neisseria sp. 51.81]MDD9328166.1 MmcQ/YjbR family DNA-binding protein [Neisseria sp. 51.81]
MTYDDVLAYAAEKYGTRPDYPWQRHPEYAVLRHRDSRKWYGLLMKVAAGTLGVDGGGRVEILNVKAEKNWVSQLRGQPGFLPAYHMDKANWLTILLDGSRHGEVAALLAESYRLTGGSV